MLASTLVDRYTCYLNALIILVNLFGCIFPSISCNRQLGVNIFARTLNYLKSINLSSIVTPHYFCSLCSFFCYHNRFAFDDCAGGSIDGSSGVYYFRRTPLYSEFLAVRRFLPGKPRAYGGLALVVT